MSWLSDQLAKSKRKGTGIYSWAGGGKGATLGTTLGTVVPGVGNLVGAAIGAVADTMVDSGKKKPSGKPKEPKNNFAIGVATGSTMDSAKGFSELRIFSG